MRFAVLVLSFSGALSQCASYSTNVQSACDLTNPPTEDTAATRFCNGACNTALNTASNGCSASVTDEAESKQAADSMLAYCSGPPSCTQAYTSMQAECDLANPPSPGNEATRFCNGACNAAVNTTSNVCSASVTEEAQGKQNADQMLSHCSPPSSPPSVTETSGSGLTKVQVDVTSDKGAGTPSAEYFIGIWTASTPPISISLSAVTVTATSTGYKATIEPPTGKTAKELVDELPNGADIWVKDLLNAADATLKVTAVGFCVEPSDGSACGGGGDDPCFSREAEACRIVDTSVAPFAAFRACFDDAAPTVAERVKMTALTGGDYILSAGKDQAYEFTRVIVNQHKLTEKRSSMLKIAHADGEIELTPDHVLLVDGQWAPAHTVKVGSSLSGSKVTAISHGVGGIINPVTVSGMIVAAGATGGPVISSAYPEWIAEYMLEQNNGYYPLPVSMSSMLAYFFPATVQAYWDEVLEHAFAANQKALNAIPTPFVAPIMFVLDLVCSAGLLLFALANAKVIATLVAVVAVARARRVAKA